MTQIHKCLKNLIAIIHRKGHFNKYSPATVPFETKGSLQGFLCQKFNNRKLLQHIETELQLFQKKCRVE
jgi:hypothetical protein